MRSDSEINEMFQDIQDLIQEYFGKNNKIDMEYLPVKKILNVEFNDDGCKAYLSYEEFQDEFQFLFDRGMHPYVVATLVNLINIISSDIIILQPYFMVDDKRYTKDDAEDKYLEWVIKMVKSKIDFNDDSDGEVVH